MPVYNYCVLCGRKRQDVGKLICGVKGGVCYECVSLCLEIIQRDPEKAEAQGQKAQATPSPEQPGA